MLCVNIGNVRTTASPLTLGTFHPLASGRHSQPAARGMLHTDDPASYVGTDLIIDAL